MNRNEIQKLLKKTKILNIVIKYPGLSKTQIKLKADISMESAIYYLDALEKEGLVYSKSLARAGKPGRKADSYYVVPDSSFYVGIKFLAHRINGVVINLNGEVVNSFEEVFERKKISQNTLIERITKCIDSLYKEINSEKVVSIGISCPGVVDIKKGMLNHYTSLTDNNIPLKKIFESKYGIPVYIDSSIKTKAVHYTLKHGTSNKNLLLIYIGSGISSALVSKGNVFRCDNNFDGEIGHITVPGHHGLCSCGRRGCLETVVGNSYVFNQLYAGALNARTYEDFSLLLKNKEEFAIEIMDDIVSSLGNVLSNLMAFCSPDEILICGQYVCEPLFQEGLKKYLKENCLPELTKNLKLNFEIDDNNTNAIEAATLAFYQNQNDF